MVDTKRDAFVVTLEKLAAFLLFVSFAFITVHAYITTYGMDIFNGCSEHFWLKYDNIAVNITLFLAFVLLCTAVRPIVRRFSLAECIVLLSVWFIIFGFVWVLSARTSTGADSQTVYNAARSAANGDLSLLSDDYFKSYPFQLGYLFFLELLYRILPESASCLAAECVNVFCVALTMCGLACITKLALPESKAYTHFTLMALLFVQVIPFTVFVYGNIPALTCGVYAVLLFMLAVRCGKMSKSLALSAAAAFLLGTAVNLKYNSLIFTVALLIVAVLEFIRRPRVFLPIFVVLAMAFSLALPSAVKYSYEKRTNIEFGSGVPMAGWLAMGLSEAYNGPGWYNGVHTVGVFFDNDCDPEATSEEAIETVRERLEFFAANNADRRSFFTVKIMSQWNEPTYQSLWLSQVRGSVGDRTFPASAVIEPNGAGERALKAYMNQIQQIVFLLFTVYIGFSLISKSKIGGLFPLYVVIIGGFLYHLLFEAKSQYVLTYVVLMLPVAGAALEILSDKVHDVLVSVKNSTVRKDREK